MKAKDLWWGPQLNALAQEMSKLAIACDIDILKPGIGVQVLRNDTSICGRSNPEAFRKLRQHAMAFYEVKENALERLDASELSEINDHMIEAVRKLREAGRSG